MTKFALLIVVLALLAPRLFDASYEGAKGPKNKAEKNTKGLHDKTDKEKAKPVPVPEPATTTLLATGAGLAIARKLWKNRGRQGIVH
jgi:hypothetical protein